MGFITCSRTHFLLYSQYLHHH